HQHYDILVTPTTPIAAFEAGADVPPGWHSPDWTSWTPYTYPFNMTQQPALSIPCGTTDAGLPVGVQLVGARFEDRLVVRTGAARAPGGGGGPGPGRAPPAGPAPVAREPAPSPVARPRRGASSGGSRGPGGRLGDAALARPVGGGRGPLREAMQRLAQGGLLI